MPIDGYVPRAQLSLVQLGVTMRTAAQVLGTFIMIAFAAAWLWLGFALPDGRPDISRWLKPTVLYGAQYGLTAIAIWGAVVGFLIWCWGKRRAG